MKLTINNSLSVQYPVLNVGDKCRVQDEKWYNQNYLRYDTSIIHCQIFLNSVVTIKEILTPTTYRIVEDYGQFIWRIDMFSERLAEAKLVRNIGDVVRIKPYSWFVSKHSRSVLLNNHMIVSTTPDMFAFAGTTATITSIIRYSDIDVLYVLDVDGGLNKWHECMFDETFIPPAKETKTNNNDIIYREIEKFVNDYFIQQKLNINEFLISSRISNKEKMTHTLFELFNKCMSMKPETKKKTKTI